MLSPISRSVQAPAVTTTVSARTEPRAVCTVTPSASSSMRSAGVCQRTSPPPATIRRSSSSRAADARATPASGENSTVSSNLMPGQRRDASAPSRSSTGMPRSRSCSWIAISPAPVPPSAAPAAVRDQAVQSQQRLAARRAERVPALAGQRQQIEVVLVGIGVVEVAGRPVRGAARVAAGEPARAREGARRAGSAPRPSTGPSLRRRSPRRAHARSSFDLRRPSRRAFDGSPSACGRGARTGSRGAPENTPR